MQTSSVGSTLKRVGQTGLGVPLLLLILLAMMVLPLPPLMLDMLFTFNIALSLVVLLAGVYSKKPLDFAAFPTILLLATLLRLALNVATTRVVLLHGHNGTDAAGQVIEAFGEFVIGGNYTVGIIVFIVLVIINFIVVTKGAGRISEVSARFTLDAMPGKQMAIDADLNAGIITQDEARTRRDEVVREADFYGSMDGASKFVRGDAIAGILILFINIIGGLAIGIFDHGMEFKSALHNYTLLTIGDGLVAQIPSLILSTASAILVTRVSSSQDMGGQILQQLFENPKSLGVTSGVIAIIGLIPGMPNLAFLTLAALGGGATYYMLQQRKIPVVPVVEEIKSVETHEIKELSWDDVVPVDTIGLEVGYKLIPLVDRAQGGQLMNRIKGVRKKLTNEFGFLVPPVHIRDNLELTPNAYRISLRGVTVGESEVFMERDLAINPGQVLGSIAGIATKDPAFGLSAIWIDPSQKDQAQMVGYTVVDTSTVIATHLSQILQNNAQQLLGREEVQQLLENLKKTAPKLAEDLPNVVSAGNILKVLQNLLEEKVPIRDIRSIAETLADVGARSQDPAILTASVRINLGRSIVQQINGLAQELPVIVLAQELEQILQNSTQAATDDGFALEPGLAERLHKSLAESAQRQEVTGQPAVLLVSPALRWLMSRFVRHSIPGLYVLSYSEVPDNKQIKIVASIGR